MKKTLFTLFLALIASAGTLFAESGTCGDNLTWDLTDSVLTISGIGSMNQYNSYSRAPWYSQLDRIKSVVINETVTSIGNSAFYGCSSLKSVIIGKSITSIESYAFYGCRNLISVTIPDSVTSIGDGAFYGCNGLISATIGNSVRRIGYEVFRDCSSLASVTIGNSVKSIGTRAFYYCSNLCSVTIPYSITNIEDYAFFGCNNLKIVNNYSSLWVIKRNTGYGYVGYYADEVHNYYTLSGSCGSYSIWELTDGVLTISGTGTMNNYDSSSSTPWYSYRKEIQSVIINDGITSIGSYTFCDCSILSSVTIPNSVTSIGWSAFANCSGLTSVTIPNSVTTIGEASFYGCSSLISMTIPNSVEIIKGRAFYGCSNLTSVVIGNSVTSIGERAFYECSQLTSIDIPNSVKGIGEQTFSNCSQLSMVSLPQIDSLTNFGENIFQNCHSLPIVDNIRYADTYLIEVVDKTLSVYLIREGTRWIDNSAFSQCSNAMYIDIPSSVIHIGSMAFSQCSSLVSFSIPDSVKSIGMYTFKDCINLTTITVGKGIKNWERSLMGCNNLQNIIWNAIDCNDFASNDSPFYFYKQGYYDQLDLRSQITSLIFGNSVKHIPAYLCSGMYNADSISVPCSVESIGVDALFGCRVKPKTIIKTYLSDTILCHIGAQICDEEGNCQSFYHSGIYTQTYTNVQGCDSIVSRNVILKQDTTFLPDTTVCYGAMVSLSGNMLYNYRYVDEFEASEWDGYYNPNGIQSAIDYFMEYGTGNDGWVYGYIFPSFDCEKYAEDHGECNEQIAGQYLSWFKSHFHQIYGVTECPDSMDCDPYSPDGQTFYSSGTLTRTYTNISGCDSVVSRNVIVSKAAAPKIIATPEQDTFNSGTIRIYNKYCTGSEYYEGQYNYFYQYAEYDYFTINGKKYDFSSAIEGEYNEYYHQDGIRVIDEPSTVIDNLSAGEYHIVFYSSCDSIAKDVTIETKGIEIDGIYYIIQYSGLKVTYRGSTPDEYDEYSGNVIIPDSAIYNGEKLPIVDVDENAFHYSPNLSSITFNSILPSYNRYLNVQVPKLVIYVPFGALETYKYMIQCYYYNYDYSHYFGYKYSYVPAVHVIHLQNVNKETSSTASVITLGNSEDQKHISSCGIVDGEERSGNVFEYIGLNPDKEYTDVPLYVKTIEGDYDIINISFTTTALELVTKPSKPVSSTTALLFAETNMSDAEVSGGFEYKRNDAPANMDGTKVFCPVANGQMAGRLKNLKDDTYYKYRAFYQSKEGNMYYGDWKYIFTGDDAVEFQPIVNTIAATAVGERQATLRGYALEGSDDFTEQGFEYWADSRVKKNKMPARSYKAQIGDKKTVTASGISMTVTLTDLDPGSVYKYRTYAKIGDKVIYGSEMSFTTLGEWVSYTVTFVGKDGKVISTQEVEPGKDAVAPEALEVDGFRFTGWDKPYTNIQSDLTITAQYTEIVMVTLVVKSADESMGTVKGGGEYAEGISVKITAVPKEGYQFVMWNDGNTTNPRTVIVSAGKTYTAVFEEIPAKPDPTDPTDPEKPDQALDQITNDQSQVTNKILRDGQILILRGDKTYTLQGQEVK